MDSSDPAPTNKVSFVYGITYAKRYGTKNKRSNQLHRKFVRNFPSGWPDSLFTGTKSSSKNKSAKNYFSNIVWLCVATGYQFNNINSVSTTYTSRTATATERDHTQKITVQCKILYVLSFNVKSVINFQHDNSVTLADLTTRTIRITTTRTPEKSTTFAVTKALKPATTTIATTTVITPRVASRAFASKTFEGNGNFTTL